MLPERAGVPYIAALCPTSPSKQSFYHFHLVLNLTKPASRCELRLFCSFGYPPEHSFFGPCNEILVIPS